MPGDGNGGETASEPLPASALRDRAATAASARKDPARQAFVRKGLARTARTARARKDPARTARTARAGKGSVGKGPGRRRHPLLGLAALVLAVGASAVLPAAGMLTVAALLTVLRTGNRARTGVDARRKVRGPRFWDPALAVVSIPWALVRSVAETVLLAPLLLAAAFGAAAAWTEWLNGGHYMSAWSAVAAAYATLSCLGPRSRRARRELSRALSAFASSPLAAVVSTLTVGATAMIIAGLVLIQTPALWPLPDPAIINVRVAGFSPAQINLARLHL